MGAATKWRDGYNTILQCFSGRDVFELSVMHMIAPVVSCNGSSDYHWNWNACDSTLVSAWTLQWQIRLSYITAAPQAKQARHAKHA